MNGLLLYETQQQRHEKELKYKQREYCKTYYEKKKRTSYSTTK